MLLQHQLPTHTLLADWRVHVKNSSDRSIIELVQFVNIDFESNVV